MAEKETMMRRYRLLNLGRKGRSILIVVVSVPALNGLVKKKQGMSPTELADRYVMGSLVLRIGYEVYQHLEKSEEKLLARDTKFMQQAKERHEARKSKKKSRDRKRSGEKK